MVTCETAVTIGSKEERTVPIADDTLVVFFLFFLIKGSTCSVKSPCCPLVVVHLGDSYFRLKFSPYT